jgi:hypothetical protein
MIAVNGQSMNGHDVLANGATIVNVSQLPEPSYDILAFLNTLKQPGIIFEIRALDCPERKGKTYLKTSSGYFSDFHKAAMEALLLEGREPSGVYLTVNRCRPELLARSTNAVRFNAKATTADDGILHRDWLYIDIDASRQSNISSTEAEKDVAVAAMHHIADTLVAEGWPQPLRCMSGNGGTALFRIDLPNDADAKELVIGVLRGLAARFDIPGAAVDQTTFNAARIMKIAGTTARKGSDFKGEPGNPPRRHRKSFFWPPAEELQVVPVELLKKAYKPDPKHAPSSSSSHASSSDGSRLLVDRYLADHGVTVTKTKPHGDGTLYILDRCPFHEDHGGNSEVAVTQGGRGGLKFECKHNSCSGNDWAAFRTRIGDPDPEHYDPPRTAKAAKASKSLREFPVGTRVACGDRGNIGEVTADNGATCSVHFESPKGECADKELPKEQLTPLDGAAAEADAIDSVPIGQWCVKYPSMRPPRLHGLLRAGEVGGIIAAPKVGKSWLSASLALSAAFGVPWIGFQVEQGSVLMIDNELHPETISARLRWLAEQRQLDINAAPIEAISLRGRGLNLQTLGPTITKIATKKFSYIILDAWYRLIPPGMDENSNSDMTALFNLLDEYAHETGATILAVHHTSKGIQGSKAVTDVGSGAGAQARAVDAHLIIREHEEEGGFVVDAACRSFAPLKPFCVRRNFPLWERDDNLDPTKVKQERPSRRERQAKVKEATPIEQWTPERFVTECITAKPRDTKTVKAFAIEAGCSTRQADMYLEIVREQGLAHYRPKQGNRPAVYSTEAFGDEDLFV